MTEFTIMYNYGKGAMTLNLDSFFARRESGKFINTIKFDIYKVIELVNKWCEGEQVEFLRNWLKEHDCFDIAKKLTIGENKDDTSSRQK